MKSNYHKHFERELSILCKDWDGKDEDSEPIINKFKGEVEAILDKISEQGHSGGSIGFYANVVSSCISKAILMNNIAPITGDESEWNEVSDDMLQNNRMSSVFKDEKGAYYLDAIVFVGEDKYDSFTGSVGDVCSRQYIKSFPFEPKTFYINVVNVTNGSDYKIKDVNQLNEVYEYYLN